MREGAIFFIFPSLCAVLSARNAFLSLSFNQLALTLKTQLRRGGLLYGLPQLSSVRFLKTPILSSLLYASCFITQGQQIQTANSEPKLQTETQIANSKLTQAGLSTSEQWR